MVVSRCGLWTPVPHHRSHGREEQQESRCPRHLVVRRSKCSHSFTDMHIRSCFLIWTLNWFSIFVWDCLQRSVPLSTFWPFFGGWQVWILEFIVVFFMVVLKNTLTFVNNVYSCQWAVQQYTVEFLLCFENFISLISENKAVGVMKAGHVFTIEPMICEGEKKGCCNVL